MPEPYRTWIRGPSLVPEFSGTRLYDAGVQNTDACVIALDSDAQLCLITAQQGVFHIWKTALDKFSDCSVGLCFIYICRWLQTGFAKNVETEWSKVQRQVGICYTLGYLFFIFRGHVLRIWRWFVWESMSKITNITCTYLLLWNQEALVRKSRKVFEH